jgi:hypothetical protein
MGMGGGGVRFSHASPGPALPRQWGCTCRVRHPFEQPGRGDPGPARRDRPVASRQRRSRIARPSHPQTSSVTPSPAPRRRPSACACRWGRREAAEGRRTPWGAPMPSRIADQPPGLAIAGYLSLSPSPSPSVLHATPAASASCAFPTSQSVPFRPTSSLPLERISGVLTHPDAGSTSQSYMASCARPGASYCVWRWVFVVASFATPSCPYPNRITMVQLALGVFLAAMRFL